jgi:hypothetical protein
MSDKNHACPVCGGKLYKVHRRLICGRCPYGMSYHIPEGTCHCGCGEATTVALVDDPVKGWVKGEPKRFVRYHNLKIRRPGYTVVDRGYETPCWVWNGALSSRGYGATRDNEKGSRKVPAHRYFWERENGPVPEGLQLDHLCRVRACVNPDHMEPVTAAENVRRGANTRITANDARAIFAERGRRLALPGYRGGSRLALSKGETAEVAAKYGTTVTTVRKIWNGEAWRDVSGWRPSQRKPVERKAA